MLGGIPPVEFAQVSVVGVELFVHVHLYVDDSDIDYRRVAVIGAIFHTLVDLRAGRKTPFDTLAVTKFGWCEGPGLADGQGGRTGGFEAGVDHLPVERLVQRPTWNLIEGCSGCVGGGMLLGGPELVEGRVPVVDQLPPHIDGVNGKRRPFEYIRPAQCVPALSGLVLPPRRQNKRRDQEQSHHMETDAASRKIPAHSDPQPIISSAFGHIGCALGDHRHLVTSSGGSAPSEGSQLAQPFPARSLRPKWRRRFHSPAEFERAARAIASVTSFSMGRPSR